MHAAMSGSHTDMITLQDFARLTDKTIISDYVAAYDIPNDIALPNGALGWYDLPAIMAWLFPAQSNPAPILLVANHQWVPQSDEGFQLQRTSAAEEFPPDEDYEEILEDPVPTLVHYPPEGLPVDSSVDVVDAARKLEDGRLEVKAALERLTASVAEATFLYTQANLMLDEEVQKTASLMALVASICGQEFADGILRHVERIENVEGGDGVDGDGSSNGHKNNFVQRELQPSSWRVAINKARFGKTKWPSSVKEASNALREHASAILMPPPNFIPYRPTDSDDEDEDEYEYDDFLPLRSTAISRLKRSRPSEDEDASPPTSLKHVKTKSDAESRMEALPSLAAAMLGMVADPERKSIEDQWPSSSHNGEQGKELNTTGPRRPTYVSPPRSPQSHPSSLTGIREI